MKRFFSFLLIMGFICLPGISFSQDQAVSDSMLFVYVQNNDSSRLQKYFGDIRVKPVPPDTSVINKVLLIAVYKQKCEMVRFALSRGASISTQWYDLKSNVVHFASIGEDLQIMADLFNAGADMNIQTSRGTTALMYAISDSNLVMIQFLFCLGSDLNLKDTSGKTAIDIVVRKKATERRDNILEFLKHPYFDADLLFQYCRPDYILKCLKERPGEIRYKSGKSALHYAVLYDEGEICRKLIGDRLLLNGKDSSGRTPLHYAAFLRNDHIYKQLLASGAGSGIPDKFGETPAQVYQRYTKPDKKEIDIVSSKIWDDISSRPELVIPQNSGGVWSLNLSDDGKYAVTANGHKMVMIWDVSTGKFIRSIMADSIDGADQACFSGDGKKVIAGANLNLKVWDIRTRKTLYQFERFTSYFSCLVMLGDGVHVLTGKSNGQIDLWDIKNYRNEGTFTGHNAWVRSLTFTADGNGLLSGSLDGTVRFWDIKTGSEIRTISGRCKEVNSIAYCDRTNSVAAGTESGKIKFWSLLNGKEIQELDGRHDELSPLCFSTDGRFLLSASRDAIINQWDLLTKHITRTYSGHKDHITSLIFVNDEKQILSASRDSTIRVWDTKSGNLMKKFGSKPLPSFSNALFYLNEQEIVAAAENENIFVWDNKENRIKYHGAGFLPDNRVSATADRKYCLGVTNQDSLLLWDYGSGDIVRCFNTDSVRLASFTPGGKFAISLHFNHSIKLWDIFSGALIRTFSGSESSDFPTFCISRDDRYAVTSGWSGTIKIWDIGTGLLKNIIAFKNGFHWIRSLAVSSDNKFILAGSTQGEVLFISASTGDIIRTFSGHTGVVNSVCFSADDKLALTASDDNTLKIWETESGKERATLVFLDSVNWVVTTPSGLFDASDGAMKEMYFVAGMEIIEFSQLKHRYWQPGLMPILMGYSNEPLRQVPAVDLVRLYPESKLKVENGLLKVRLRNRNGGIGKVTVFVNDIEIIPDARRSAADSSLASLDLSVELSKYSKFLSYDTDNIIKVITWNSEGYLSSRPDTVHYIPSARSAKGAVAEVPEQKEQKVVHFYAIVVGTSDYQGSSIDLQYAAKDATDFGNAIRLGAERLFGKENVSIRLLTAEPGSGGGNPASDPLKGNIKKAFDLSKEAKPEDILVVYLSGHGVNYGGQDGDFYYLTRDASGADAAYLNDPFVRNNYTISSNELTGWINTVPARKKILVLDACASGKAAEVVLLAMKKDVPASQVRALDRMADRTGFYILAGSASDAVSYETGVYGQGLLTYSLLKAIRGAALRQDGAEEFIDVSALLNYAVDEVPKLAQGIGGVQKPLFRSPGDQRSFDIGRMDREDKEKIVLAEPKPVFVACSFIDLKTKRDGLKISGQLNARLREISAKGKQAEMVFTEATDYPGACQISGSYAITGDEIQIDFVVYRNEQQVGGDLKVTGKLDAMNDLMGSVIEKTRAIIR